jgi:beta propeller repeat protein
MMKHQIGILCAVSILLCLNLCAIGFEAAPVDRIDNPQQTPDVDNGKVVWAEQVEGDWDVYGVDLLDESGELIFIADFIGSNQIEPRIWNDRVVYQDNSYGDWDVYVSDIANVNDPVSYLMTLDEQDYLNDQTAPGIHGNTAVWQSYVVLDDGQGGTIEDWDIYAADITEPNNASVYIVDDFLSDQQQPTVYRSKIVYQDNSHGDWDVWQADVWLKNAPQYESVISDDAALNQSSEVVWGNIVVFQAETAGGDDNIYARNMSQPASEPFLIADGAGLQQSPDISGHLVVWQDDRNGNFDIYGYNLITRQEFQITADLAHQKNPAISGLLVVWEDSRVTPVNIYHTWLDGDVIADCPNKLAGDADGNCRVDLTDFVLLAEGWLACGLEPATACGP